MTGIELGQEPWNVRRVVLAVAVDGNQDLTARLVERGSQGRRLSAVPPQYHDTHMLRITAQDQVQPRRRSVGRAVINKDQLITQGKRPQDGVKLGMQGLDVVDLVEHGNQDREVDRCRHQESETLSPKPEIRNPKSETLSPKP